MLQRVWGNGEPPTLLVGMQTGVAATEKSKEIPKQKKTTESPYDSAIFLLGTFLEKTIIQKHATQRT